MSMPGTRCSRWCCSGYHGDFSAARRRASRVSYLRPPLHCAISKAHYAASRTTKLATMPPAAGWCLLLLILLLAETLTGLFVNNDVADVGPFTTLAPAWIDNLVTDLHGILWQALLAAIALHLLAIAFYWTFKRQNLVLPMIVGRKVRSRRAYGHRQWHRRRARCCCSHAASLPPPHAQISSDRSVLDRQCLDGITCPRISPGG